MKNKINLRKLIFILIGMFFCVIPIEAKAAADYKVSFKFYKIDSSYTSTSAWLKDFKKGTYQQLTDLSSLSPGDVVAVVPDFEFVGTNATAEAVSIYFRFDKDTFQLTTLKPNKYLDLTSVDTDPDAIFQHNYDDDDTTWTRDKFEVDESNGTVSLVFRDSYMNQYPFDYKGDRKVAFVYFEVKEGGDPSKAAFTFATDKDPIIDSSGESATGKFVTMAAGNDENFKEFPIDLDTEDYIPEVKKSSVKSLKDLVIANGSDKYTDLSWTSGSTETSFNSVIPASISDATLSITPFHSAASIMCTTGCTGSASAGATMTANLTGLTTGSNSIEVTVTAEDGTTQIYPIDIKKLNDDTSLESVTLTNGITLNYDTGTKTYSAIGVPYNTTSTNISASVTTNSNAVIDSTGTTWTVTSGAISNALWNLTNTGATANTGTIKVNAENCDSGYASVPGNTCTTTTYNVSVSRNAPKTIATLKSLTVGGNPVTGFVPDDATHLEYTIADTTAASLVIAGTVTDNSGATITSGTGTVSLVLGDNTFNIVVTAEDGTTSNTYKIKVKRLSTDATLSGLSITSSPQGTMNPASFVSGTKSYTYTYDETVTSVSISATASNSNAMVQIGSGASSKGSATGSVTPTDGGTVDITTTAEDGTTHDSYRITFARKKSTVNTLSSLSVTDSANKEYITSFNSATNTYNITVENDITSLNVSATATSASARVGSRTNSDNTYTATINNLGFSSNVHTITVYPEETTATNGTYTINITRKQSNNANLTDLQVDGTSLTGFDGTQNGTYNLSDVDSTKASVTISSTKANNEASVAITNNGTAVTGNTVNLSEGNNVIVVAVTSQDGTKTIRHTINIKKKSSVATLSGLSITSSPQGTMNPATFATGTKTYKYIYDETVGNVTINATATNSAADVKIGTEAATKGSATSNSIDPKTTNSVDIVVTAEDGHSTDTYTINFERKKSSVNTLSNLSAKDSSNNEYITTFSASTKTYNITVPHDVDSLNISATATSDVAKINNGTNTYTGTMNNLNFTSNSLVLTVSPEQGTDETYTINVTRTKSDNAYLTDLRVDGTTVNGFNKLDDSTPFDIGSVANSVTSLNITYDKENQYSVDVVSGNSLSVGDNTVTVKITSQDGTKTMEYKIKVRRKSIDVGFASLNVVSTPQGTLTGPDGSNVYTFTYDRTVTDVDIQATANSGKPVVGAGTHSIASGDATLTVTPEDETASVGVYTIKFVQELETDSSLTGLSVAKKDGTAINIGTFTPTGITYSATVDSDVDKVDITADLSGSYAKKISIGGTETNNPTGSVTSEVSLTPGSNPVTIIVTAEDNSTTTYTINITRTINTSATLTDLQVDGVQVPGFNSSTTTYNLTAVDYTKDQIVITAVGASGATVTGDGTKSLTPGDNTFNITVDSQDGNNHATYTINIRRKLNDAKITNLTSSSGTTLSVGATEFAYTLDIPSGTNSVSLTPTFMTGATLKTPTSLDNIDVTSISEIRFTVQAEDTNYTNEYVITLNKLASTNADLSSLSVDHGTLNPSFDKDTKDYTLTVDSSVDTLNVTATVADTGKATLTGDGSHTLSYGTNTITVTVTAEDRTTTKDYVITVTRPKNSDTSLSDLTIDGTTIAGFTSTNDTYNISLPFGTTSFVLGATPTDSNANILDSDTKLGTMTITGSSGTYTFEVEAQDGTKKTYTINVTVAANNDTAIDSLTVLGKTPTWNAANNRYELTVDGETLKVSPSDVVGTFGNGASITNKDAEKNLAIGANSYKFTVTAADGTTTKEYEVYITREASAVNTLDTLTSDVGTFTPSFDKDTNSYKLTLPEGTTEFTISATATSKNPATSITGTGKYTIPVTDDKVEVIVTAEDGSINTYEVTIEVESSYCSIDCDFDGDGVCDLNCDTDGDGTCDLNCDTDRDGKCDINCDTDKDGKCDLNCDSDGDGVCDYNCDTDGDGVCDDKCLLDKIVAKATGSYTTDDDYVLGVRTELNFDDTFKAQFDNDSTELVLYLDDGTTKVTSEYIGTGMILKLERNGKVLDQKSIVILGDTNGDGKITTFDAVLTSNHFIEFDLLQGAYVIAADANKDSNVTTFDAVLISNHFIEFSSLFD